MIDSLTFIDVKFFLISFVLFFLGLIFSIPVVNKNFVLLLRYPLWIWGKLKSLFERHLSFFPLFILILLFNSFSLLINIFSGFGLILPFLFSLWTGMNVGIIGYYEGKAKALIAMCLSPHAFFELPAVWISLALGMKIGFSLKQGLENTIEIFYQSLNVYFHLIIPLLIVAAIVEAALISFSIKNLQHSRSFPDKPFDTQQYNHNDQ